MAARPGQQPARRNHVPAFGQWQAGDVNETPPYTVVFDRAHAAKMFDEQGNMILPKRQDGVAPQGPSPPSTNSQAPSGSAAISLSPRNPTAPSMFNSNDPSHSPGVPKQNNRRSSQSNSTPAAANQGTPPRRPSSGYADPAPDAGQRRPASSPGNSVSPPKVNHFDPRRLRAEFGLDEGGSSGLDSSVGHPTHRTGTSGMRVDSSAQESSFRQWHDASNSRVPSTTAAAPVRGPGLVRPGPRGQHEGGGAHDSRPGRPLPDPSPTKSPPADEATRKSIFDKWQADAIAQVQSGHEITTAELPSQFLPPPAYEGAPPPNRTRAASHSSAPANAAPRPPRPSADESARKASYDFWVNDTIKKMQTGHELTTEELPSQFLPPPSPDFVLQKATTQGTSPRVSITEAEAQAKANGKGVRFKGKDDFIGNKAGAGAGANRPLSPNLDDSLEWNEVKDGFKPSPVKPGRQSAGDPTQAPRQQPPPSKSPRQSNEADHNRTPASAPAAGQMPRPALKNGQQQQQRPPPPAAAKKDNSAECGCFNCFGS